MTTDSILAARLIAISNVLSNPLVKGRLIHLPSPQKDEKGIHLWSGLISGVSADSYGITAVTSLEGRFFTSKSTSEVAELLKEIDQQPK